MKISTVGRRIGATDIAALLGTSKYQTPEDVLRRLVEGKELRETMQMRRGKRVEPDVRRLYQEATGAVFQQWVARPLILQHETHEWATCSPDDITTAGTLVEYKSASVWAKGWSPVPVEYTLQVLYALWVAGLERGELFVAFGSDFKHDDGREDFAIERTEGPFVFERDPEMEAVFADVGSRFWTTRVVPTATPTAAPTAVQTEAAP